MLGCFYKMKGHKFCIWLCPMYATYFIGCKICLFQQCTGVYLKLACKLRKLWNCIIFCKDVLTESVFFSTDAQLTTIGRLDPDRYVMKGYPKSKGKVKT